MTKTISTIIILMMIGGMGYGFSLLDWSGPNEVWTHPTLSVDEQLRVKAECRMRALERFGASHLGSRATGREQYTSNCLIAEGFTQELVEKGGEE